MAFKDFQTTFPHSTSMLRHTKWAAIQAAKFKVMMKTDYCTRSSLKKYHRVNKFPASAKF